MSLSFSSFRHVPSPRFARSRRRTLLACLVPVALLLPACTPHRSTDPTEAGRSGSAKTSPSPRHPLRGQVVRIDSEHRRLHVHHEEIPGFMPAMTMEFTLGDADLSSFREGQHITATMVDDGTDFYALEGIRIVDTAKDQVVAAAARALKEDTTIRGRGAYREVGEAAPLFALYDQDGAVVQFDRLRGKRIVLNFIFTRCPVATMCPAATARMAALQQQAHQRKIPDLQLISISLDPTYDTPPVLKAYAQSRGIDTIDFSFLTGPEDAVRSLLVQFGVLAERSENVWKHTLATVLIDRDGRILHRVDGSAWEPEEFLQRL